MKKKELIEIIITGCLVLVLILAVSRAINKSRSRTSLPKTNTEVVAKSKILSTKLVQEPNTSIDLHKKLISEAISLQLVRDPFTGMQLTPVSTEDSGALVLNGILWDNENSAVIINDNVYKVGDKIGPNIILAINRDSVTLNNGESDFKIKLSK